MAVEGHAPQAGLWTGRDFHQNVGFLGDRTAFNTALNRCLIKSIVVKNAQNVLLCRREFIRVERASQGQASCGHQCAGIEWSGSSCHAYDSDKIAGLARKCQDDASGFRLDVGLKAGEPARSVQIFQAFVDFRGIEGFAGLLDDPAFELVKMQLSVGFEFDP
jgi:hypothetical protein